MKNIIVPTDFSDYAQTALRYAISIANRFGSAIHLVNGVDIVSSTGIYTDVNNMIQETAMIKLKDVVSENSKELQNLSVIIPKTIRGEIVGGIVDYAKDVNADLIVMGTQGASGLKEIFIGTTAQGVIKHSKLPVLVIPKETKLMEPKQMALTVDQEEIHSEDVLSPFKKLVQAFDAKAIVFHFNAQYEVSTVDPNLDKYLSDIDYSTHNHYSGEKNVERAINEFVKEEGIDLLTMVRRKRSFFDRIFHKSVTTREVFHSKVPVLILHENA